MLKPIARADFEKVLKKIQKDFEEKDRQQDYYKKFEREMKEYENNSRRDFFEMLVTKHTDLQKIYEKAENREEALRYCAGDSHRRTDYVMENS